MNITQQLRALSRWLVIAIAFAAPFADANAQNVIESIASTQQGPKVVLRVTMKETLEFFGVPAGANCFRFPADNQCDRAPVAGNEQRRSPLRHLGAGRKSYASCFESNKSTDLRSED